MELPTGSCTRVRPRRHHVGRAELPTLIAYRAAPIVAAVLAVLTLLSTPAPARAECPYLSPWPALTEFGRSAREILVGTVVRGGGSTFLDFRVDRVLRGRGKVGEVRRFENLLPNWPPGEFGATSCSYLIAADGDVIALGLDALAPDRRTRIQAAAWIRGRPTFGSESAALSDIEAVAAMPPTSTAPETSAPAWSPLPGAVVVMIAVVASLMAVRRRLSRQP